MTATGKRTTVYLDPELLKLLKFKSAETDQSVSRLINDAIRITLLEEAEDLKAFDDREEEPSVSFDSLVRQMKADGKL